MGNPKDKIVSRKMPSLPASNHVLASGERARYSGIYKLEHHLPDVHEVEKDIFISEGTWLPFCRQCARPLQFRLVRKMDYIAEDPDFQSVE